MTYYIRKLSQSQASNGIEEVLVIDKINNYQCRKKGNNLHIVKLVLIVHLFAHNNVREPIIKQRFEDCHENATYKSHETSLKNVLRFCSPLTHFFSSKQKREFKREFRDLLTNFSLPMNLQMQLSRKL